MENKASPDKDKKFQKPVSVFEHIAQNKQNEVKSEPLLQKKEDEEKPKEKTLVDFLFPIRMLF